ncbi:MAG: prephenate dehydrogenase [Bacillota bacterium]
MNRVGIVGLGLIGGSLGLALRTCGWQVIGYDCDPLTMEQAHQIGACDCLANSVVEAASTSQVLVVAVPSSSVAEVVVEAAFAMKPGSVLTDVASVKGPIVKQLEGRLPAGVCYVGGHPMAGSEKQGIAAARADLFRNAVWTITPCCSAQNDQFYLSAVEQVTQVIRAAGANPLVVDPEEHDLAVAFTSHLPYLTSLAIALTAQSGARRLELVKKLVAGGFRDATRLARSSPSTACDYSWLNRERLKLAVQEFERQLARLKHALDQPGIEELAAVANSAIEYLDSVEWGIFDVKSKGA